MQGMARVRGARGERTGDVHREGTNRDRNRDFFFFVASHISSPHVSILFPIVVSRIHDRLGCKDVLSVPYGGLCGRKSTNLPPSKT